MAEKIIPIKTDLFRFVTIRTPQLIQEEKKKLGFIEHPDPTKSFFLKGIDTESINEARNSVRSRTRQFKDQLSIREIEEMDSGLNEFSSWLLKNAKTLTEEEVKEKIQGVNGLAPKQQLHLWDNVFHQSLVRSNPRVRQGCIRLLIADNLIRNTKKQGIKGIAKKLMLTPRAPEPPSEEERFTLLLRRLASAKVVLPRAFTVTKRKFNDGKGPIGKQSKVSVKDLQLKKSHLSVTGEHKTKELRNMKREIRESMNLLDRSDHTVKGVLGASGVNKGLSRSTKKHLESIKTPQLGLGSVESGIDFKIREESDRNRERINNVNSAILEQRKKKKGKSETVEKYRYFLSTDKVDDELQVFMTIHLGYDGGYPLSSDYELSVDGKTVSKASEVEIINAENDNAVFVRLFPDETIPAKGKTYEVKGSMTFNNKESVGFTAEGAISSTIASGVGAAENTTEEQMELGELYGVSNLGIGVLRKVEQEVCCYVPGEVSRIENILAREYKERHTRSLLATEETDEETTELEVENQSDTVSTSRNELQTEIASELNKDTSIGTGASLGVSGKMFGAQVDANAYFDFASSTSSSSSDSEAQMYAEELTNSALERILQKTTQKRTSRILQEFEENNRHGFDNREGTQHVTGVYRWIDILYKNHLVNYGKRLMVEFLIPEPARFYREAIKQKAEKNANSGSTSELTEPTSPKDEGISSYSDITEKNYLGLGRKYGVTLDDPITPTETMLPKTFGPGDDSNGDATPDAKERDYQFKMTFLEFGDYSKYLATGVKVIFNFDYHYKGTEDGTYFKLKIDNHTIKYDKNNLTKSDGTSYAKSRNKSGSETYTLNNIRNDISFTVDIKNVYNFSVTLEVDLELDEQETINWQNSVYDEIMSAYEDQMDEYEEKLAEMEEEVAEETSETLSTNPDFNRTVEQREIQRLAIEMITRQFGFEMGEDFYSTNSCNIPQVLQNDQWAEYASKVKFFEQAFDWGEMGYLFYPYYWADQCDWVDLLQTQDAGDPIFESFLQSGMARAVIPVRKGFEEAVNYYMETGDVWNGGGMVVDTSDDLYLSIDEELMEVEGVVERSWMSRVPTSLTIVQGSSVYLEDESLPCCDAVANGGADTLLRGSDVILGISSESTDE